MSAEPNQTRSTVGDEAPEATSSDSKRLHITRLFKGTNKSCVYERGYAIGHKRWLGKMVLERVNQLFGPVPFELYGRYVQHRMYNGSR